MGLTALRDHDSRSEQPIWAPISWRAREASPHVTFGHLTCRAWEAKRASNAASRQKNQSGCKCYFSTAPKLQIPSSKLQGSSKNQAPKLQAGDPASTGSRFGHWI